MEPKNYKKILIISSNFYPEISDNLIEGATTFLDSQKIMYDILSIAVQWKSLFFQKKKNDFSGYIILSCIVEVKLNHYEVVKI